MAQKNSDKNNKSNNDDFVRNPNESSPDHDNIEEDSPVNEDHVNQINETGSILTKSGNKVVHCLTIIGQIEGHYILSPQNKATKYEHVIPQLVAIDADERIDGLLIILNTVGGDVEAGLAIAELISGMRKPTVSIVLGGGHSIGIPLAVAAKKSFIAKSASMTVHPVRSSGVTIGVSQSFEYFQRMQDRITTFVSDNSNITKKRYTDLVLNTGELVMDIGTILDGEDAVKEGLIDAVGTLSEATKALYDMINEKNAKKEEKTNHNSECGNNSKEDKNDCKCGTNHNKDDKDSECNEKQEKKDESCDCHKNQEKNSDSRKSDKKQIENNDDCECNEKQEKKDESCDCHKNQEENSDSRKSDKKQIENNNDCECNEKQEENEDTCDCHRNRGEKGDSRKSDKKQKENDDECEGDKKKEKNDD